MQITCIPSTFLNPESSRYVELQISSWLGNIAFKNNESMCLSEQRAQINMSLDTLEN